MRRTRRAATDPHLAAGACRRWERSARYARPGGARREMRGDHEWADAARGAVFGQPCSVRAAGH